MQEDESKLSDRELEILQLVATGASNKEIANQLFISTNTVKVHLRNIFQKIGVTSRTEAALYALNSRQLSQTESEKIDTSESIDEGEVPPTRAPSTNITATSIIVSVFLIVFSVFIYFAFIYRPVEENTLPIGAFTTSNLPVWKELSPMPTARFGLAVASYESKILAIGGMTDGGVSGIVEIYDPATDQWSAAKPKPTPVYETTAAVINGKIYLPGGKLSDGKVTDLLEIYDPRTNTWEKGNSLPAARCAYALAVFEGYLYLFGGWDGKSFQRSVYQYDPFLDSWTGLPDMPTKRGYHGAAVAGRSIYVFGGFDGKQALTANEELRLDSLENEYPEWEEVTGMPEPVYGMGSTDVADIIFSFGGSGDVTEQYSILSFFHLEDEWRGVEGTELFHLSNMGVGRIGTTIYVVGGQVDSEPVSTNKAYQLLTTITIPIITK